MGRLVVTRRSRPDANQREIVDALERVGASVLDLHDIGVEGAPDLLVGRGGVNLLIEIKTARGRVRQCQREWHEAWRGQPVVVARSVDEALEAIGAEAD
jgi:Holliday junction resolvase